MALTAIIDQEQFEALETHDQAHYVQKDGMYFADIEPVDGYSLNNDVALKAAVNKERENVKERDNKIRQLSTDIETLNEQIKELNDANKGDDVDSKIEAMRAQLVNNHEAKVRELQAVIATKDQTIVGLKTANQKSTMRSMASNAISDAGGNVTMLLPHVESAMKAVEDDEGHVVFEMIDPETNRTLLDARGVAASVAYFVDHLKKSADFASAFKGSGASGSGASDASRAGTSKSGYIDANNDEAIESNLEAIATGKIKLS
jgi:hypothetical protein